jgi:hypothetical protein
MIPGTNLIRGQLGPRVDLDAMKKNKILSSEGVVAQLIDGFWIG